MGAGACNENNKDRKQSPSGNAQRIDELENEIQSKTNQLNELQKKYDKLLKDSKKIVKTFKNNKVDLTPEYIQSVMEENSKNSDKIASLNNQISQLNTENYQLKLACGQYQLMLFNYMSNNMQNSFNFNNNHQIWRNQINDFINNNNFNNSNNNNNFMNGGNNLNINSNNNNINNNISNNFNNTFNSRYNNTNINNNQIMNIIFKFEGGQKYTVVTFNTCRLRDVFSLMMIQNGNNNYSDITQLKFRIDTRDITNHFLNNDEVKVLGLPKSSIIEVISLNNVV